MISVAQQFVLWALDDEVLDSIPDEINQDSLV